jgi:glycine hydroxymethyltransferase
MAHKNVAELLLDADPDAARIFLNELKRQECTLEMVAAENFVSELTLQVEGNIFTNKYAEGQPKKRYYGGCTNMDDIELLAVERAKKLFGAEHINVQPHAGSQANMAVYHAAVKPGDTVLAMELTHGGHLTHGSAMNFSGQFYKIVPYHVRLTDHRIDFDEVAALAAEHRPAMIICGASAYPRVVEFDRFAQIAADCKAVLMADIAHIAGLVAAKVHPSPVPYCDFVTTTTHKTLRGPRGAIIMCREKDADRLDKCVMPGIQGGPLMHSVFSKAVAFGEALKPEFAALQRQTVKNAAALAQTLLGHGLALISGGTDNHIVLVNLSNRNITGKQAEQALEKVGIVANRNTIPGETRPPYVASGIRFGTPALTTRGLKEAELTKVGNLIAKVLKDPENESVLKGVAGEVREISAAFPIYPSQWPHGKNPREEGC